MVTAEEQPPFVHRDEFERRSAEFDRRFTHLDDGLRELRQGQKDLEQGQRDIEQHLIVFEQRLTVLEQGQKALGRRFSDFRDNVTQQFASVHQRFDDFKESTDRRFTMLTWTIAFGFTGTWALLGWLIARGGG